jgi:hypothetical protein
MRIRHGEEDAHSESRHHDYDRPPCLFQANKHSNVVTRHVLPFSPRTSSAGIPPLDSQRRVAEFRCPAYSPREFAMVRRTHTPSPVTTITTAHHVCSRPINTVPKVSMVLRRGQATPSSPFIATRPFSHAGCLADVSMDHRAHLEEDAHSESRHHDYDRPPCLFQANKHSPKGEHGGPS